MEILVDLDSSERDGESSRDHTGGWLHWKI